MLETASKIFPKRQPTSSGKPPVSLGKYSGVQSEIWTADLHNDRLGYGRLIYLVPYYLGPRVTKAG